MSTSSNPMHLCELVLDNDTYMHLEKHKQKMSSVTVDDYRNRKLHAKPHSAVTLDSKEYFVKKPHHKMLTLRREQNPQV